MFFFLSCTEVEDYIYYVTMLCVSKLKSYLTQESVGYLTSLVTYHCQREL